MSYFVCHVKKFKMNAVKGLQKHNQRETDNLANKDIDRTRSDLNYDLHNQEKINYNEKVKEIIDSKYIGKKSIRKDATVLVDTLVSSDKEFFKNLSETEIKRYFEESYNKICDMYGKDNIISAVVHMDETTPHMHLLSVPLTQNGRLSAKSVFDRNKLRSLQDEIPKELQNKGFLIERGKESDRKHTETFEHKLQQRKVIEKEIDTHIESAKSKLDKLKEINNLEGKNILGVVTLKKDQYEKLLNLSKEAIDLKSEVTQLSIKLDNSENNLRYLQNEFKQTVSRINKNSEREIDFASKNARNLKMENNILKENNLILKNNNQILSTQKEAMVKVLGKHNLLDVAQKLCDSMVKTQVKERAHDTGWERERTRNMGWER